MTNTLAATAAPDLVPCREFPANAPAHVDEDVDPRDAWADGWNACRAEVQRRLKRREKVLAMSEQKDVAGAKSCGTLCFIDNPTRKRK